MLRSDRRPGRATSKHPLIEPCREEPRLSKSADGKSLQEMRQSYHLDPHPKYPIEEICVKLSIKAASAMTSAELLCEFR